MRELDHGQATPEAGPALFLDPPRTLVAGAPGPSGRRSGNGAQWALVVLIVVVILGWRLPGSASLYEINRLLYGVPGASTAYRPAPQPPEGEGGYAFINTQPGSPDPVTYDPCTVIHVAVNHTNAPPDADRMVAEAVDAVARAAGLPLVVDDGDSPRALRPDWRSPTRVFGTAPPPILIGWATPQELPALDGKVAGLGGSSLTTSPTGRWTWSTGQIALDAGYFAILTTRRGGYASGRAVVMHELGHVVGLAHVDDPGELMAGKNTGRTEFGDGDRRGLYLLGQGRCARGTREQPWDPGTG